MFLSLILIDIVNKLLYIWCDNDEGGGVYVCVYLYSEEGGKERNYCYFLSDTFSVPKVCVVCFYVSANNHFYTTTTTMTSQRKKMQWAM